MDLVSALILMDLQGFGRPGTGLPPRGQKGGSPPPSRNPFWQENTSRFVTFLTNWLQGPFWEWFRTPAVNKTDGFEGSSVGCKGQDYENVEKPWGFKGPVWGRWARALKMFKKTNGFWGGQLRNVEKPLVFTRVPKWAGVGNREKTWYYLHFWSFLKYLLDLNHRFLKVYLLNY